MLTISMHHLNDQPAGAAIPTVTETDRTSLQASFRIARVNLALEHQGESLSGI